MPPWKKYLNIFILGLGSLILISLVVFHLGRKPEQDGSTRRRDDSQKQPPARAEMVMGSAPARRPDQPSDTSFSLGEKIYAAVFIRNPLPGRRTVSFHWINPSGNLQERFDKTIADSPPGYRCWSWIKLSGDEFLPVSIGPFSTKKFLGKWRVEIYLDGIFLTSKNFVVE